MPSKNSVKIYVSNYYYHVYNRGAHKKRIFHDEDDYKFFLYLLKRHLSKKPQLDNQQRPYRHLTDNVDLVAYCLMPNHFHLLFYNKTDDGIELLMRSLTTAYSLYYNRKYDHSGHLFQGVFKASMIDSDVYLQHISRYIHRNPENYLDYAYSSYRPLITTYKMEWLSGRLFDDIFDGSIQDYEKFVADYDDYKKSLDDISEELAN